MRKFIKVVGYKENVKNQLHFYVINKQLQNKNFKYTTNDNIKKVYGNKSNKGWVEFLPWKW